MTSKLRVYKICKMRREYKPDKDKKTRVQKKDSELNQGFMKRYIN